MLNPEIIDEYMPKWYILIPVAVFIYILSVTLIKDAIYTRRMGCKNPPYAHIVKFSGVFALMRLLKAKSEDRLTEFLMDVFAHYPNNTFFLRLAGVLKVVFTVDPDNMKAVLATQFNDFSLGRRHAHFKPLLGDGVFTLDGEAWKFTRGMLRPQFAREQIGHVQLLEPHVQVLAKHIELYQGETFDLQKLFFQFTVDTSTELLFGESVHSLYDEHLGLPCPNNIPERDGFAEAFGISQTILASRAYSQIFHHLFNSAQFRHCNKKVQALAQYYVQLALELTPEELEVKSKGNYTFLYELVKKTRSPKMLQDQLLNIMVAGRDTTAGLLSFTMFELARNPEVWAKLKDEIYTKFGGGDDSRIEEITFESLKKCDYLKSILQEALRMYPAVPINFRVANKDTTLPRGGGTDGNSPIFIPKGSTVAYSVYVTHRREEFYGKDADKFRPERWDDLKKLGWAYLPFNGGPRICLGQQFALTEASYVIARLAQMFPNIKSMDPSYPPKQHLHLTASLQPGTQIQMWK
ncbi:uncharacterized protein J8A68_004392 [[Candida] subhashii]|uniref:Uncharacterized protein n=1 Tax=[Candida] subhashii TaxID=561895 RepID=A0A8J5QK09_9ASCO|nr:uncharacterized protein J8A68_004392 [[Candida] subhashii]KAG7662130.1 hypothetical protein J8A68_004392 [[Candida] subhashii]